MQWRRLFAAAGCFERRDFAAGQVTNRLEYGRHRPLSDQADQIRFEAQTSRGRFHGIRSGVRCRDCGVGHAMGVVLLIRDNLDRRRSSAASPECRVQNYYRLTLARSFLSRDWPARQRRRSCALRQGAQLFQVACQRQQSFTRMDLLATIQGLRKICQEAAPGP